MPFPEYTEDGITLSLKDYDWDNLFSNERQFQEWRWHMIRMQEYMLREYDLPLSDNGDNGNFPPYTNQFQKFVPVNENWCGNYSGNLVEVTLTHHLNPKHHEYEGYMLGVWGNDDSGVNKKFPHTDEGLQEALICYNSIQEFITAQELLDMGLEY